MWGSPTRSILARSTPTEINSRKINSHEINFLRDQFPYDQLISSFYRSDTITNKILVGVDLARIDLVALNR